MSELCSNMMKLPMHASTVVPGADMTTAGCVAWRTQDRRVVMLTMSWEQLRRTVLHVDPVSADELQLKPGSVRDRGPRFLICSHEAPGLSPTLAQI